MSPVTVPPALGKAALAVVVVEVKTASLAAMSTPSTVPETTMFPVVSVPVLVVSNFLLSS